MRAAWAGHDRKMKTGFAALIFDMDGTLVNSERVHRQAWIMTLDRYGTALQDFQEFKNYVGVSDEQMAGEFISSGGLHVSRSRLVADKQAAYHDLIPGIELLPGVRQILCKFKGSYRMAVASSSPYREVTATLAHHGLVDYFEVVVGGDMVVRKKPDPEIYLLAASRLGLLPAECIAFEDSQTGVDAAASAGLTTVAVPHAMSLDHDFSRAVAVVASLEAVDEKLFTSLQLSQP